MGIPAAGEPIPAAAIPALARAGADFAAGHGDPSPVSITAVVSSRGEAVEYASRGNQIMNRREDPVYLVRMEGDFFVNMPRPHSTPLPTGRFLFVVFDPRTLGSMDVSLSGSDDRPPMSTLGPVTNLMGVIRLRRLQKLATGERSERSSTVRPTAREAISVAVPTWPVRGRWPCQLAGSAASHLG